MKTNEHQFRSPVVSPQDYFDDIQRRSWETSDAWSNHCQSAGPWSLADEQFAGKLRPSSSCIILHGDLLKPWSYYLVEEQWTFSTVFDKIFIPFVQLKLRWNFGGQIKSTTHRWLWSRVWASEFDNPCQCLHLDFVMIFYGIKFSSVSKLVILWFYTLYHESRFLCKDNFLDFFFFFFNISCHLCHVGVV